MSLVERRPAPRRWVWAPAGALAGIALLAASTIVLRRPQELVVVSPSAPAVDPAWQQLMRYRAELGHGEIEKLKIQDGLPMAAEVTTRKVKFSR